MDSSSIGTFVLIFLLSTLSSGEEIPPQYKYENVTTDNNVSTTEIQVTNYFKDCFSSPYQFSVWHFYLHHLSYYTCLEDFILTFKPHIIYTIIGISLLY